MSEQLTLLLHRLQRIETKLDQVLTGEIKRPARMPEAEVIKWLGISRSRLQQLRLGYRKRGVWHDPIILKWGHRNGRHIDYDVAELEELFQQTTIV